MVVDERRSHAGEAVRSECHTVEGTATVVVEAWTGLRVSAIASDRPRTSSLEEGEQLHRASYCHQHVDVDAADDAVVAVVLKEDRKASNKDEEEDVAAEGFRRSGFHTERDKGTDRYCCSSRVVD